MQLRLNIITLSLISLFMSAPAVSNLRGRKQQTNVGVSTFRIAFRDINRGADDNRMLSESEELMSIPIVEGVESSSSYNIELPDDFKSAYRDLIKAGSLFVNIKDAIIDKGSVIYLADSAVSVLDEPPSGTRKLELCPPANNKKIACRDSSSNKVTFKLRRKKTITCSWISEKSFRQKFCNKKVKGNRFLKVSDVCQKECAPTTKICTPN